MNQNQETAAHETPQGKNILIKPLKGLTGGIIAVGVMLLATGVLAWTILPPKKPDIPEHAMLDVGVSYMTMSAESMSLIVSNKASLKASRFEPLVDFVLVKMAAGFAVDADINATAKFLAEKGVKRNTDTHLSLICGESENGASCHLGGTVIRSDGTKVDSGLKVKINGKLISKGKVMLHVELEFNDPPTHTGWFWQEITQNKKCLETTVICKLGETVPLVTQTEITEETRQWLADLSAAVDLEEKAVVSVELSKGSGQPVKPEVSEKVKSKVSTSAEISKKLKKSQDTQLLILLNPNLAKS